jgi:hypothetical protein
MAGSGRRVFAPGEVLTASNVMNYLQDQAVMNFADDGARGSAIGSAVSDGMVSYLSDTNSLEVYKTTGTAFAGWEPVNLAQSPNYIINGAFEINQRSFTSATTDGYGFDRWRQIISGDGTKTYSSQTFTLGDEPSDSILGSTYARILTSGQSSTTSRAVLAQAVENVKTLSGQTATVSFWARAGSGTPKVAVEFQQNFGSGGSPSTAVNTYAGQVTLSTSWVKYSLTVTIPSLSGKTIGTTANTSLLDLSLAVSAGSDFDSRYGSLGIQNNTFDFWGVQVEEGSTATPFSRNANSIQGELAACQRYYVRFTDRTTAAGYAQSTTVSLIPLSLPVETRTTIASVEWSGGTVLRPGINQYAISNIVLGYAGNKTVGLNITSANTSATASQAILLNMDGYIGLSAEL